MSEIDNPFDQLGLKKEILVYLLQQGRLENFLKDFYRTSQKHLHPDKGGSNDLSALVNAAHQQIRQHPSQLEYWIQTMQNGANPEYLELIECLAGEVERLRKTEQEYGELKVKYAETLTGKRGKKSKVRTAHTSRRDSTTSPPPRVDFEEPDIHSPPRSSRAAASSEPSAEEKREEVISTEPIELHDIVLYGPDSKPFRTYKKVILAGELERGDDRRYLSKTQDEWVSYWREKGKQMMDFPLFYAIVEKMQAEDHPGKAGFVKELKTHWLSLATRFNYKNNKIIHGYGFSPEEFSCAFPLGNNYLDEVKEQKKWRSTLQALLMPKDLDQAIETLQQFSSTRPYIWTPDKASRKLDPERAAYVDASSDGLNLVGDLLVFSGRSRWVELRE